MKQLSALSLDMDAVVHVEMTAREYFQCSQLMNSSSPPERRIRSGLASLSELFQCSIAQAHKIAHSEWFKPALLPVAGRRIVYDETIAVELAKKIEPAA